MSYLISRTHLLLLTLLVLISGCTGINSPAPENSLPLSLTAENTNAFGPRPDLPDPASIHLLAPAQKTAFLAYMNNPAYATLKPGLRLYQYLSRVTSDYHYEGTTNDAATTLSTNGGNCMSLAILTTALADLAGIRIGYQLMDDVPVYEINGTTVKKGVHIRTKLFAEIDEEDNTRYLFSRPGMIIDYFPTNRQRFIGNIGRDNYLAMYYQNLAVEAIDRDDLNTAYWSALEALNHVPMYSAAINTLAITTRRAGDLQTADTIYRFGIEHADDKLSLMKNYVVLLTETGRDQEAARLQTRLDNMEDNSPFHWYQLAKSSFNNGNYSEAIRFYDKALLLAPYLHEAWLGIAQANYELGQMERSRHALEAAYQEADKVSTRNLYQAKLVALGSQPGL